MMSWYAVKLLYRMKLSGKPARKDAFYNSRRKTFYEESVLLVQADSFDLAYALAGPVAETNCATYTNKYGQTVHTKVFAWLDCFHLYDEIESGTEVYSSIFDTGKCLSRKALVKKRYSRSSAKKMHMLHNLKFSG